jgi:hypothetical protein
MSTFTTIVGVLLIVAFVALMLAVAAAVVFNRVQRELERQRIGQQATWALMRLRRLQHDAERQMHTVAEAASQAEEPER